MEQSKKISRKVISVLLSLLMVFSCFSGMGLTAWAADATELAAETTTWENGDYVVPAGGVTISDHITVNGTVNLTLTEGTTLTANAGITLSDGATLNVSGEGAMVVNGSNNNASSTVAGTGMLVLNSGTLTAKGGNGQSLSSKFMNNKTGNTGGVAINGTVIVSGGTLAATGGDGGSINGDTLSKNNGGAGSAAISGAVTINSGTLAATGGNGGSVTITSFGDNNKGGNGGAAIGGAVTINGGTLTATKGNNGTLTQSGGYGNSGGAGGAGYDGTLTLGANVKLYEGTDDTGTVLDGNDSDSRVYEGEKKAKMFASDHSHSFSYTVDGNTITATCEADGCPLTDAKATLTIAAPQHTAVGDGKSEDAQITDANNIKRDAAVSYYATDASSNKTGDALTEAPTAAGTYWAEITLGTGDSTATAHVVYTITDPDYNVTLPTDLVGGTVTADKISAKYGEAVTLTVTPETGFTIKTVKYNDKAITVDEGVYSFTMPASDVTVSVTFEGAPFDVTISDTISGGTVTVASTLENGKAKAGSTVTLTVTPGTGFQVDTVKYNNTTITASEGVYKFIMPAEAVTVSATFTGHDTTATLNVAGDKGPNCTAKLLHDDYTDVTNDAPLTKKGGEQFILLVNRDEGYGFTVTYGSNSPVLLEEFTEEEYTAYVNYANENNLPVSSDMVLARVTMPGVAEDSVTLTVKFSKLKTFTILYQPSDTNTAAVWCKFAKSGSTTAGASRMHNDAEMGDGNKVFSLKVTAADNPDQLAFVTDESNLESATMGNATVSQNTDTWNNITGGKYLVIGGEAKTVVAAFVTDKNAIPFYNSDRGEVPEHKGAGVTYRITVVANGNPGTVTAPAAPANSEKGTQFAGWSALVGTAPNKEEIKCAAGATVQITENTSFNATWEPKQLTVTLNLNGGQGVSGDQTVTYGDTLPTLAPTKDSFAFDGWTVDKTVIEGRYLYLKGSTFIPDTKITSNMGLTAEWKHVHTYTCYRLQEVGLQWFYDDNAVHVAFCSCYDYKLMAHEYGSDGMCACGKHKPEAGKVQLDVTYGQLENGKYTVKFKDKTRMEPQGKYVTLSASNLWGSDWSFSKWQYSTDEGNTWKDLAVTTSVKFGVMCNMRVRAVYEESADAKPQVELNASKYDDHFENNGTSYPMDNIAFQMSYKLPADCTFVDGGLRFGDNDGIGYYDIKERTVEGNKAGIWAGCMVMHLLTFSTPEEPETSYTERYYELRKNNALDEMTETELAKYIYEGKTTKAKIDPIYWDSRVKTEGNRGAIATRAPLNMTNAEEGNNWIYGIAWMRYKDSSGKIQTIYTNALATTLNGIVQGGTKSVTKTAAN